MTKGGLPATLVALTLLNAPLCATIFHTIDSTAPLPCTFSAQHHNRIGVERGRLNKIICPEGPYSIRMEEESGQAFVQLLEARDTSLTLSVITDKGSVQDLEIQFEDKTSETIILVEPTSRGGEWKAAKPDYDPVFEAVQAIRCGRVPHGFAPLKKFCAPDCISPIVSAKGTYCFQSADQTLLVLELQNTANAKQWVSEAKVASRLDYWSHKRCPRASKEPFCRWVYIAQSPLDPGQKTLAIVALRRL